LKGKHRRQNFYFLFLLFILLNIPACTTPKGSSQAPKTSQTLPVADVPLYGDVLIKTELIFGLSKPDGDLVSEAEWQKFLDEYITPRFREGLTVLDADGQYLTQSQQVIKERSKIVILLYKNSEEINASIEYIRSSYKQLFQQESVLRVSTPVGVSF
jgi:hypothetical protein